MTDYHLALSKEAMFPYGIEGFKSSNHKRYYQRLYLLLEKNVLEFTIDETLIKIGS